MLQTVFNALKQLWNPNLERCGVILGDNTIIEKENTHQDPKHHFSMEVIPAGTLALWHTHPSGCPNLSIDDYHAFKQYPEYIHIIIGQQEVAYYYIDHDGSVIRGEDHVS